MTDTDMKTENMIYKTAPWKRAYDSSQAQIGIQNPLEYCRNRSFLSYPSFEQAPFILQWEADDRIAGIGTDGVKILFSPVWLLQKYEEDPGTVTKAYLHMTPGSVFICILFLQGRSRKICGILPVTCS